MAGRPDAVLPAGEEPLRLLLDVGVAEVFRDGALAALRLGGDGGRVRVEVTAHPDRFAVRPVTRWFGVSR